MKSREIPPCKQNVPDPYKWHAILEKIYFAEHGYPDVIITFDDPINEDERKTDT